MPDAVSALLYNTSPAADQPLPDAKDIGLTGVNPIVFSEYINVFDLVRGVERGDVSQDAVIAAADFAMHGTTYSTDLFNGATISMPASVFPETTGEGGEGGSQDEDVVRAQALLGTVKV